jgi:hypothetical protein
MLARYAGEVVESVAGDTVDPLHQDRRQPVPCRAAEKVPCTGWREWLVIQVRRYRRDIDPDDGPRPILHGLLEAAPS